MRQKGNNPDRTLTKVPKQSLSGEGSDRGMTTRR